MKSQIFKLYAIFALFLFSSLALATDWGRILGNAGVFEEARRDAERRQQNTNADNRRWDAATLKRENSTGDYSIKSCQYQTFGGFEFSTNVRKYSCPYQVYINVESMHVQIP